MPPEGTVEATAPARVTQRGAIKIKAMDGRGSMPIGKTLTAATWPGSKPCPPEVLVNEIIEAFRARYKVTIEHVETAQENVNFKVPRVLREAAL